MSDHRLQWHAYLLAGRAELVPLGGVARGRVEQGAVVGQAAGHIVPDPVLVELALPVQEIPQVRLIVLEEVVLRERGREPTRRRAAAQSG
jgi:hypothetical protein